MAGLALIPCYGAQAGFHVDAITQQPDGFWFATATDGSVVSVRPDGSIASAASVGEWERAGGQNLQSTPNGGTVPAYLTYCPVGTAVYQFFVSPVVPNV